MSTVRLVIDHDKCTGLGLCEAEAPDLFEVQDDGSLLLLVDGAEAARHAACQTAVGSCPTEALRLVQD